MLPRAWRTSFVRRRREYLRTNLIEEQRSDSCAALKRLGPRTAYKALPRSLYGSLIGCCTAPFRMGSRFRPICSINQELLITQSRLIGGVALHPRTYSARYCSEGLSTPSRVHTR